MLKKTITYVDYNGKTRTDDFYFNLSKAELVDMEMSEQGSLSAKLEKIVREEDKSKIVAMFKDIVLKAYGEKSDDGKRFVKSQEIRDGFMQTEAYSDLFMELASNAEAAAEFINGIIPKVEQ